MRAEVTFDLVMGEDMGFVEGCYRLPGNDWEVFVIAHSRNGSSQPGVWTDLVWKSGVRGLNAVVPASEPLNKAVVLNILSQALGVSDWNEVRGPDSIVLR